MKATQSVKRHTRLLHPLPLEQFLMLYWLCKKRFAQYKIVAEYLSFPLSRLQEDRGMGWLGVCFIGH